VDGADESCGRQDRMTASVPSNDHRLAENLLSSLATLAWVAIHRPTEFGHGR